MSQATKTIEVNAPADKLYAVIVDFAKYTEYLSGFGLTATHVIDQSETAAEVETIVTKMGQKVHYTLRYQLERPRRVSWILVKSNLMKENRGAWELQETAPGRTRAKYTLEVSAGFGTGMILTKLAESELPGMLDAFRMRAEASAGS